MNPYLFLLYSTLGGQQTPHTQICAWLKGKVAPPWSSLTMQPSNSAIMTRVVCTSATRNVIMDFLEAAIAYSDANWHPVNNPTAITALAAMYPDPLHPDTLEALGM